MMSKQFAELGGCRMVFGKNLSWKLSQRSAYLGFAQLHDPLLICWHSQPLFCIRRRSPRELTDIQ
jgi:hypothetical protein